MTVQVASIGLSQIGVSAALALGGQSKEILFKGWDPDLDARVAADRFKVFNPVCKKAQDAVRGANLVVLSLPSDEFLPTLKVLDVAMSRDVALVNMSPMHAQTYTFVEEVFGEKIPFISIFPTLNPNSLQEYLYGARAARSDLFDKCLVFIADAQDAPPAVLDLAADIAVLLGGQPVFTTPKELDGLIVANLLLPQLCAAALINTAARQPSWQEGGKIAGGLLFHGTLPISELYEYKSLGFTARANRENMVRLAEDLMRELIQIRDSLKDDDPQKLSDLFNRALDSREDWLLERQRSETTSRMATSIPEKEEALKRFLKLAIR